MDAKGVASLQKMFEAKGVEVTRQPGDVRFKCAQKLDQSGLHVTLSFPETDKCAHHEIGYKSLMLTLSKELWHPLLHPLLMVRAHYIYVQHTLLRELVYS